MPQDSTHAYFVSPAFGDIGTGTSVSFQWTPVSGAIGYQLMAGKSPGSADLYDSGVISSLSATVSNLPASGVVYARVRGILQGGPTTELGADWWSHGSDIAFRTDDNLAPTDIETPTYGYLPATNLVSWVPSPEAIAYRVRVGLPPAVDDIDDSGVMYGHRRLLNLPGRHTYALTLETIYRTQTLTSITYFTSDGGSASFASKIQLAKLLTGDVRLMANIFNQPHGGSSLFLTAASVNNFTVVCTTFTQALLQALQESNIGLPARPLDVCFNNDGFDCHELVEIFDADSNHWSMLDPTFGLRARRADGIAATSDELSSAVRAQQPDSVRFENLTANGDWYARSYYLDYPTLFIDVDVPGQPDLIEPEPSDLSPFFSNAGSAVNDAWQFYALQCAPNYQTANAAIDGGIVALGCSPTNGFTQIFGAATVSPQTGDASVGSVWRPKRIVFPSCAHQTGTAAGCD